MTCDHDFHVTLDSGQVMGQYLRDGSGWSKCQPASRAEADRLGQQLLAFPVGEAAVREIPVGKPRNLFRVYTRTPCASTACELGDGHTGPHGCARPFAEGWLTWWDDNHPRPADRSNSDDE